MIALRLVVHGRVQGVGYRNWTAKTAAGFGIDGWVRNTADGTVEMLASGTEEKVARFLDACRQGPPLCHVERIDETVTSVDESLSGFSRR